jgi:uncharacterized protein (TIGR04141 family)
MSPRAQKKWKLSVSLLKGDIPEYNDALSESAGSPNVFTVRDGTDILGELYIKGNFETTPSWIQLFSGGVSESLDRIRSKTVSAVLFLKVEARIFAVTFGYGRSMIRPELIEEKFGLKVVLNSIDRDKIRIIDRKNLDTMLTHTRTQTSRISPIEEFNLDVQQILLKAVTGEPRNREFASNISGADSLSITYPASLENIKEKCKECLDSYNSDQYRRDFPWVDNILEIKSKSKREELDTKMVQQVIDEEYDKLYLAVPDIVDWSAVEGFKFSVGGADCFNDILLGDFLGTVSDHTDINVEYLKRKHIYKVNSGAGAVEKVWSVYNCINCEIPSDDKIFLLTEGKWYEIESSYVEVINSKVRSIELFPALPATHFKEKENNYCSRMCSDSENYALMDRKNIMYGGGRSRIEFCDIYTADKELIHIKKYSGSSVLSHLFLQGVNSARLFLIDSAFREAVNEKLPENHKFDLNQPPIPSEYKIIFAIISDHAEGVPENLPFFSKLSLVRAVEDIRDIMRFKVSVTGIPKESDQGS